MPSPGFCQWPNDGSLKRRFSVQVSVHLYLTLRATLRQSSPMVQDPFSAQICFGPPPSPTPHHHHHHRRHCRHQHHVNIVKYPEYTTILKLFLKSRLFSRLNQQSSHINKLSLNTNTKQEIRQYSIMIKSVSFLGIGF